MVAARFVINAALDHHQIKYGVVWFGLDDFDHPKMEIEMPFPII